jgi:hypothetical protein
LAKTLSTIAALVGLGAALAGCAADAGTPPAAPAETAEGLAVLALDQRGAIGEVAVTPLRIEEDSRCPTGVQCIQAGTVRVAVRIEAGAARRDIVLTLAEPLALDRGRRLTLAAVCPYPHHPGTIGPAAYRFTFALGRDGAPPQPAVACLS